MHIGLKIKELAESKNLTAPALGKRIGVTKQAVYDMYQKEDVNTSLLKKVASVLGVPVSVFFDEPTIGDHYEAKDGGVSGRDIKIDTLDQRRQFLKADEIEEIEKLKEEVIVNPDCSDEELSQLVSRLKREIAMLQSENKQLHNDLIAAKDKIIELLSR